MDLEARRRWVDYAEAKDDMFAYTDTRESPWYVVEADDKRTMRLNLIGHLLSLIAYEQVLGRRSSSRRARAGRTFAPAARPELRAGALPGRLTRRRFRSPVTADCAVSRCGLTADYAVRPVRTSDDGAGDCPYVRAGEAARRPPRFGPAGHLDSELDDEPNRHHPLDLGHGGAAVSAPSPGTLCSMVLDAATRHSGVALEYRRAGRRVSITYPQLGAG